MGVDAVEVLNVVKHDDTQHRHWCFGKVVPPKCYSEYTLATTSVQTRASLLVCLCRKGKKQGTLPTVLVLLVTKLLKQLLEVSN